MLCSLPDRALATEEVFLYTAMKSSSVNVNVFGCDKWYEKLIDGVSEGMSEID